MPITRVRVTHTHAGPPVFYFQGGPGLTNMVFPMASRCAANHDVVLVCAAIAEGAVGSWLGLHAFSGPVATLGAVAGAVLGANLAVIVMEILFEYEGGATQTDPAMAPGTSTVDLRSPRRNAAIPG